MVLKTCAYICLHIEIMQKVIAKDSSKRKSI